MESTNSLKTDITTFKKNIDGMAVKSISAWENSLTNTLLTRRLKEYSREEVERIINSSSLLSQRELSRNFFYKDNFYKRIVIYYATLLKYVGILIPNPSLGNKLSTPYIQKKYNGALDYLEKIKLQELFTRISLNVLRDGCYYGIIQSTDKNDFTILDLPVDFCRSNYKDFHGNDIIEFNVAYFDKIIDNEARKQTLKVYPEVISRYYTRYKKNQEKNMWIKLPTDLGFCFYLTEDCRPFFLDLILPVLDYDQAVEVNKERDLEEIRKIIVQKVPHLADGTLLFEPPEAEVMHEGTVKMLSGNKNISVLTTYGDVDAIVSNTSSEATTNSLEKSLQNIYSTAGISGQLFAPTGSQALSTSIKNDIALMTILSNKYSNFITYILNSLFSNSNVTFKYIILPVSYYDTEDFIKEAFKLAQSGYSLLLPAVALGITQRDLVNLKDLENDSLDLLTKLLPLSSSYTQGTEEVGRPRLSLEEKSQKTIQNEQSLDNNGGSNE